MTLEENLISQLAEFRSVNAWSGHDYAGSLKESHAPLSVKEFIFYFILGWLGAGVFCLFL